VNGQAARAFHCAVFTRQRDPAGGYIFHIWLSERSTLRRTVSAGQALSRVGVRACTAGRDELLRGGA
jgi:hypothetical protein